MKFLICVQNKNTVYDLDDADYLEVNPKTIYYFAKHCEKISAGSKQIEKHLSQFNSQIIHTSSPVVDLGVVKAQRNLTFTIGWLGSFSGGHKESLIEFVFPAVKALKFPLKFVIIGVYNSADVEFIENYFRTSPTIEIYLPTGIDWNDEKDIQKRISTFDIGIATLANCEMQLSKSGIKAKQYLNNGIPVLSTNLPENNSFVLDSVNGYHCDTIKDFNERILQFYTMEEAEYFRFSRSARESIQHFDHCKYYSDFEKLMSSTPEEEFEIA